MLIFSLISQKAKISQRVES